MNKVYRLDSTNLNRIEEAYSSNFLNTSKLINKLYPFSLILKDEETNNKFCQDLMKKFELPSFTEIRITSRESPTIFSTSSFSSFEPTWATHQWVKIFSIWLRILIFVTFCDTNHSNVFLKMGVDSVWS